MKKRKIVALALAICLCAGVTPFLSSPAKASPIRETVLSDNFDGETLSADWTADTGVQQKAVYSCMRIKDMNIWQPAIMLQAYEIKKEKPCTVSFDINVKTLTGWLGFFVGARSTSSAFYESSAMWMMSSASVGLWLNDGANLVEQPSQSLADTPLKGATGENVVTVRYALEFSHENAQGAFFDATLSFGPKDGEPTQEKTYENIPAETYMGFTSMANLFVDIMNFKIEEDGKTVFFDDFSSGSIVYPGSSNPEANWRVTHTYGKENVFVGALKRVVFDGVAEGKLYSNVAIEPDTRCETLFEMNFTLFLESFGDNAYFGVGFGLSAASEYADSVNMIAFRKEGADGAVAVKLVNGEEVAVSSEKFRLSELGAGNAEGAAVAIKGYYDDTAELIVAGTKIAFEDMEFGGTFAVASAKKYGADSKGSNVAVDDFSLSVYRYRSGAGEDMAINFEGVKEFEQFGETYREHYYDRNLWYLSGSGVSLAPYRNNIDSDYLQMVNATGKVAFGPKKQTYSDFIVRFSVNMLTQAQDTPANTAVGLAFGKKTLDTANENASCVYFSFNGSSTVISGINMATETGETSVPCPINMWSDTSSVYNVMLIVSDGTVEVYLKRSTDDLSGFGICRAKFVNVNTYGYLALTCNTLDGKRGNFKLTDFSVTNIACE